MKTVNLILMAGRTGVGKSTIADGVAKKLGTGRIKSYTTRPMRKGEETTSDHYFISPDDVASYIDDIAAYTKINDYEYFTTWKMLEQSDGYVYVIDPNGIYYLIEKAAEKGLDKLFNFKIVYVFSDSKTQMKRLIDRGDKAETIVSRMESEAEQFDAFERDEKNNPHIIWVDNSGDVEESVETVLGNL